MAGYEDIDNWNRQQQSLLQQQESKQNEIVNQQTQMNIDALNREKEKIDKELNKTTQGLYTNYQKMANNYGVQAEQQAKMGLNNSGYAETSKINLFNTYQKNVTETINNSNNLKADFDFKIAEARKQGSLTMAQNALEMYKQRMQLATQEYEMRNNREQFLYQQERDRIADNQWQQQFDYQKSRDEIADSQWQQTFDLQKKNLLASSSRRSSSKSSSKSSGGQVNTSSENKVSEQEVVKNMKQMQGVNKDGSPYFKVKDGLTGKVYNSPSDLLASYGY
jgi:hypothetical protein